MTCTSQDIITRYGLAGHRGMYTPEARFGRKNVLVASCSLVNLWIFKAGSANSSASLFFVKTSLVCPEGCPPLFMFAMQKTRGKACGRQREQCGGGAHKGGFLMFLMLAQHNSWRKRCLICLGAYMHLQRAVLGLILPGKHQTRRHRVTVNVGHSVWNQFDAGDALRAIVDAVGQPS